MAWTDRRLIDLFGIDHPLLLAPMAALDGNAEGARRLTAELLTEIPRRTGWTVTEMSETTEAGEGSVARSPLIDTNRGSTRRPRKSPSGSMRKT